MCHLFILFYHINYSFYKMFRCSGKSPASSGIGKYCSVLWWRWHYLFFQIGIVDGFCILKSFVMMSIRTYHLHQPKQKKCQSKNSFISHHLTLHLKQIQIYLLPELLVFFLLHFQTSRRICWDFPSSNRLSNVKLDQEKVLVKNKS